MVPSELNFARRSGGKASDRRRGEVRGSVCLVSARRRGVGRRMKRGRVAMAVAMDDRMSDEYSKVENTPRAEREEGYVLKAKT